MNDRFKKITVTACCTLAIGAVTAAGVTAYTYAQDNDKKIQQASVSDNNDNESDAKKLQKDETVYVCAQADGSIRKIIVSDWIKNTLGSSSISDKSELNDIENVKGDEGYSLNSDNMKVWDANGNDIYYTGVIEKELPVNMSVHYKLDGKTIEPSELAGKSGKVTIRYEYTNNQYENVSIDSKTEKIYVPYAMLTGMMLDNEKFSDVEVSNGKVINDGSHIIVAGIALPGMQENLNLDSSKLQIPDYVEITASVTDFEMGNTVTIATNDIFNAIDTDKLDSVDELTESLGELTDAMEQLLNGSSALYTGLETLLDKSGELVEGINALFEGAGKLKNGTASLNASVDELNSGAGTLLAGLEQLEKSNETLNSGATSVFETLLSSADSQLAASGLALPKLTIENYSSVLEPYCEAVPAIKSLKQSLDGYNAFYTGLNQYTAGVSASKAGAEQLSAGTDKLKGGVAELDEGMTELYNGIMNLKDKSPELVSGVSALKDGAMSLSEGLTEFNDKGIKKLTDAVNGDIASLITRIKATADVSANYTSFSGISDDMSGNVKFIYRTDAVKSAK